MPAFTGTKTTKLKNTIMKKYISITFVAALAAAGFCLSSNVRAAEEKTATESKLSAGDKQFLKKAYKGGVTEVEHAKMAKEKATDDATKQIAERMITDHGKANDKIMEMAKEENLDLSTVEAKPAKMTGDNFDKEYLTMLKKHHEKDIALFEKANDTGTKEDSDVKKFAKDTLPTLKEHLQMVDDALAKMK
ncbi:MAG: DUF4142 domain-containing protein [Verrucomicrobiota bacterium]|nr:DUF4142 domain-containing protein [Verrucomicrobiota bacterium]